MPADRARWFLDLAVTLVMVATCGVLVWANWSRIVPPTARRIAPPAEPVSIASAPIKGSANAEFALIEYSDYQCPYCARFETDTLPGIEDAYVKSGKLLLAFRHNPIQKLHPFAAKAAAAAVCAGEQGLFWELHGLLFENAKALNDQLVDELVDRVNLDRPSFNLCVPGTGAERVRREVSEATGFGLTGTPAFLLGRVQPDGRVKVLTVIRGALPLSEFTTRINEVLEGGGSRGWSRSTVGVVGTIAFAGVAAWGWRSRTRPRRRHAPVTPVEAPGSE